MRGREKAGVRELNRARKREKNGERGVGEFEI
jgi:hypothetical protein